MREPSIHIKEKDLVVILDRIKDMEQLDFNSKKLAKNILTLSKGKSATNRNITISQERFEKKVNKMLRSNSGDAMLFSNTLNMVRMTVLKHRGFVKLNEDHKDWGLIKELAGIALNFCNDFNIPKKSGFKTFITLCLSKMRQYNLQRMKAISENIGSSYDCFLRIENDRHKDKTSEAHKIYMQLIIDKTGDMSFDYRNDPEKYIYFIDVVDECNRIGCDVKDYILSQFHGLEWTKGVPDPLQLVGPKAKERFLKYAYEFEVKIGKAKKEMPKINWAKIKKYGGDTD